MILRSAVSHSARILICDAVPIYPWLQHEVGATHHAPEAHANTAKPFVRNRTTVESVIMRCILSNTVGTAKTFKPFCLIAGTQCCCLRCRTLPATARRRYPLQCPALIVKQQQTTHLIFSPADDPHRIPTETLPDSGSQIGITKQG